MTRKSLDYTLEMIRSLDRAASAGDVVRAVQNRLGGFGVETVFSALVPGRPSPGLFKPRLLLLDLVPSEWKGVYFRNGYIIDDPIVRETLRRPTAFRWSDPDLRPVDDPRSARVMCEATEFGLRDGFTVPLTTIEGDAGGMTFAGDRLEIAPEHRGMLTLMASYAFGRALLLRGEAPPLVAPLSPRERETLQWVAEGKTDWEIGEIMAISEHSVDAHLRSVRAKLQVRTRAQAVAEGLRRNLIV